MPWIVPTTPSIRIRIRTFPGAGQREFCTVNLNSPAKDELFEATGTVRIASARIGGNVDFSGAVIRNGKEQAINADNAKIDGSFSFGGANRSESWLGLFEQIFWLDKWNACRRSAAVG
jgi:hypothetical protein